MITPIRALAASRSTRFAPVEGARAIAAERPAPRRERPARRAGAAPISTTPLIAGLVPNVSPRGEVADLTARRAWARAYAETAQAGATPAARVDVVV